MRISYSYHLPKERIATTPAVPRDSSRLFVYDTARDAITFDTFKNLSHHLPPHTLLVLNDTKVIPARAELKKETGGKIEALFLVNEWKGIGPIPAIVDRKLSVGARVWMDHNHSFMVTDQKKNIFFLAPEFPGRDLFLLLEQQGTMPVPHYIVPDRLSEHDLREKYQSVFGKNSASVAAPTASLHFTNRLLTALSKKGITKTFVTLDVGLGTFAPLSKEHIASDRLHEERLRVPRESSQTIRTHLQKGFPIVAVGTTAVRTLESQAERILSPATTGDIVETTQIFIHPPYQFKIVNAMITNFHLPETSLMMLVQAFLEHKGAPRPLIALYEIAIKEQFRFYSFGDAMLIK